MTIVVSDLVARFRADTTDVARGAQEATQQLKGIQEQAELSSRALEIMAAQFAQLKGGTASQALEMFQRAGVQPTNAALSQAASEMQRTAAAATQAVQPTQAVARAASESSAGFRLSESSIVRFGAALVGVNLGISLVAGAARQIHDEIMGSVEAARDLEVAGRAAAANYGRGAAAGITGSAAAFAADPSTRGTPTQYVESVSAMRTLTTEYGLSLQQVEQLVTASGQLARVQGVELPTAAKALDAVMRGNTSAAAGLGLALTDEAGRLRGVGATFDELVTISGRSRAEQVLLATTLQGVKTQQDQARGASDNLAAAYDRLGKNAEIARQKMGRQLSGPGAVVVGGVADLLSAPGPTPQEALEKRAGVVGYLSGGRGQLETGEILSAAETQQRLQNVRAQDAQLAARMMNEERADLIQSTAATQQNTAAVQAQLTAYESLRTSLNRTVESLGRIRQEQSQFGTIAEAARGPYFPQVLGSAQTIGAATAAQDELALRAQRVAQGQGDAMRAQLVQGVATAGDIGPNAAARAQQDLDQYDRRVGARTQQAAAQHDLALADLSVAQTQAGLSDITLRQRDRELEMQRQTIGLRQEDVRLQQVSLAAGQQVTQARIAALPTQNAVSAISYQSSLAAALAQQRTGRLMRGQDVSDLPSFDELIGMNTDAAFALAEAGPGALRAQRGIDIAQQKQTSAQLAQQLNAGVLQGSQLEVDLANLGDLPDQTGLLIQMNQNQRDQLLAQQQERDAVLTLVGIASEPPAAGAGMPNVTVTINFTGAVVRSDQDVNAIANQAADLVVGALFSSNGSGAPADRSLAGARR